MSGIDPISSVTNSVAIIPVQNQTPISPATQAKLQQLGLSITPNETEEEALNLIRQAMEAKHPGKVHENHKAHKEQAISPYASLLQQLGISPTGSKEGDEAAISQVLSAMAAQATNPADKVNVANLQAEFESLQSQANQAPFSVAQNQTAAMNKHFLVN